MAATYLYVTNYLFFAFFSDFYYVDFYSVYHDLDQAVVIHVESTNEGITHKLCFDIYVLPDQVNYPIVQGVRKLPALLKKSLFGTPSAPPAPGLIGMEIEMGNRTKTNTEGVDGGAVHEEPLFITGKCNTGNTWNDRTMLLLDSNRPKDLLYHFANNEFLIDDTKQVYGTAAGHIVPQHSDEMGYGATESQLRGAEFVDVENPCDVETLCQDLDAVLESYAANRDTGNNTTETTPGLSRMHTLYADVDAVLQHVEEYTDEEGSHVE